MAGPIIGLAFCWRLALVAIATMPLLVTTGYIRLVSLWNPFTGIRVY